MTSIAFSSAVSQASADEPTSSEEASEGQDRVRPEHLIDVPLGIILEPRDGQGRRTVFRPEQEYKCFAVEEWSAMGNLITDYRWLWYYAIRMETKVKLHEQEITNLQLQLHVFEEAHDSTQRGLESMTALLDKEHDARLRATSTRTLELWGWRIGTVIGLVAAGAFGAAWGVERGR